MSAGGERSVSMKHRLDWGFWEIAALVLAGLVYLDVLAFLVLAVLGIGLLIVYALEMGFVAGVLLLLALALYLPGKSAWLSCPGGCCWGRSSPGA